MSQEARKYTIGIVRETFPNERRVALVPGSVQKLISAGLNVLIEKGAGTEAGFLDAAYEEVGAQAADDRTSVFQQANVLLQIRAAGANEEAWSATLDQLREGQTLIALCDPLSKPELMQQLAERKVTCFAMELLPRITRAQSMDVLSSMAMVAGYKAVMMAADTLPRMFPMMMTAAGTITPAKVFIVGAGVAGLQAISAARRLGGVVRAYDVRPAVKEEVESLGGQFVELGLETAGEGQSGGYAQQMDDAFYARQREVMTSVIAESDVVITTAAVPGKKAPVLVTAEMARGMAPGSVIIDLAAEQGGNCELTQANQTVVDNGVTILGPVNLPATIPYHASQMFSRNLVTLLLHVFQEGEFQFESDDEVIAGTMVTHGGQIVNPRVRDVLGMEPLVKVEEPAATATEESAGENQ